MSSDGLSIKGDINFFSCSNDKGRVEVIILGEKQNGQFFPQGMFAKAL